MVVAATKINKFLQFNARFLICLNINSLSSSNLFFSLLDEITSDFVITKIKGIPKFVLSSPSFKGRDFFFNFFLPLVLMSLLITALSLYSLPRPIEDLHIALDIPRLIFN